MTEDEIKTTLRDAIQAQGRGAHVQASRTLEVSSATLSQMLTGRRPLPLPRAIDLAAQLDLELTLIPRKP